MEDPEPTDARIDRWFAKVLDKAEDFRAAGITAISVDGCSAAIGPKPLPTPTSDPIKVDDAIPDGIDALNDPRSYPGGVVPGFAIERFTLDEE